jgi:hypothetical protein
MKLYRVFSGFNVITNYRTKWETETLREDLIFEFKELVKQDEETTVFRRDKRYYYICNKNINITDFSSL